MNPLRWVFVAVVITGAALAAWFAPTVTRRAPAPAPASRPLPFAARCRVQGPEAEALAAALERAATARWQRVPFASEEAPLAMRQMGEAEACYRAAERREHAARAATLYRRYRAETSKQDIAQHAPLRDHAKHSEDVARAALTVLLALLDRAPGAQP